MEKTRSRGIRSFADGVGIMGSALCALHCLAAPVFLVAGTALPASFLADEAFHRMLLWVILPAAAVAFGLGCWRHKDRWVFLLGVLGFLGLAISAAILHDLVGETGERFATVASAGVLIAAHVRNFRLCNAEDCDHEVGL